MSEEQPKEEQKKEECQKDECKKEECKKKFHGFHGFGPRCHAKGQMGFPPMFGPPGHHHKHKERKCECGEVIPKRKEGEPKVKVCPKCGKDLPKKEHGFGMRCRKMRKMMKFMHMMKMFKGPQFGPEGFGPQWDLDLEDHQWDLDLEDHQWDLDLEDHQWDLDLVDHQWDLDLEGHQWDLLLSGENHHVEKNQSITNIITVTDHMDLVKNLHAIRKKKKKPQQK